MIVSVAGLFAFNRNNGNSNFNVGFRPVLVATSIHKILKEINLRWVIFKDITERKANSCSITVKMKKVCRKENEKKTARYVSKKFNSFGINKILYHKHINST